MFWKLKYINAVKYIEKGEKEKSYGYFQKMIKEKKCDISAVATYGYQLLKLGDFECAKKVFEMIDKDKINDRNELAVNMNLGLYYWLTGEKDKAIKLTEETLEKYKTTNLYINLGYFLALDNQLEKALTVCLEGREFSPDNKAILDNLGFTYFKMGELEKAEEIYAELFKGSSPSFPECYYNFGLVKKAKGETEEAKELFEDALKQQFSPLISLKEADVLKELELCRE